jgi:hypothetical protein
MPVADAMWLIVSCGAVTKIDEEMKNQMSGVKKAE